MIMYILSVSFVYYILPSVYTVYYILSSVYIVYYIYVNRYIETIYNILAPGGIWINHGPLLYHWMSSETAVDVSTTSSSHSNNPLPGNGNGKNKNKKNNKNIGNQSIEANNSNNNDMSTVPVIDDRYAQSIEVLILYITLHDILFLFTQT